MYNVFVEGHSSVMEHRTAMLPLTIDVIDHSHKVRYIPRALWHH